jgi:hypothetical protein
MTSTMISNTAARRRRMAHPAADAAAAPAAKAPSKLDRVEALLLAGDGASIAEMIAATGWQQHSLRGAMAGALRKRGLTISSQKIDGVRRYRAVRA